MIGYLKRSIGAQYATGDQWRNNSRKNEGMQPKQKEYPAVDVTGDRSKVQCCKEQYCIGTCNVRSMNQGKLEVVKKEMSKVNVDIFSSLQSISRVQLCNTLNCSTPGLPVHHQLLEFTQTHMHRVSDAIQPSHPLSFPFLPAPNPSHIRVFSN